MLVGGGGEVVVSGVVVGGVGVLGLRPHALAVGSGAEVKWACAGLMVVMRCSFFCGQVFETGECPVDLHRKQYL